VVLRFQSTKRFAVITTINSRFSVKKKCLWRSHSLEQSTGGRHAVVLQARAKCFALQRIRVHYTSLQFNINVQCYQNISQVLLTSAFILWPPCTCGFGIQEKIRCGLRFFGAFLCGFAVFGPPLRPPQLSFFIYFDLKLFIYCLLFFNYLSEQATVTHKHTFYTA